MRGTKIVLSALLGAGVALGGAGCGGSPRYEDCEVSDQEAREPDCGYYERLDGGYTLSDTVVAGAVWHWWSWVVVGQNSFAPANWKPPHGLKPPTESSESRKRRKKHEKTIKNDRRPTVAPTVRNTRPVTGSGNQGIPNNNPAPKPPKVNQKPPTRKK